MRPTLASSQVSGDNITKSANSDEGRLKIVSDDREGFANGSRAFIFLDSQLPGRVVVFEDTRYKSHTTVDYQRSNPAEICNREIVPVHNDEREVDQANEQRSVKRAGEAKPEGTQNEGNEVEFLKHEV